MKITFHETAKLELVVAAKRFNLQVGGLGEEFVAETQKLTLSIKSNPLQFGPAEGTRHQDQVRVALVRRFNYAIYFQVFAEESIAWIVAVQHTSRDPSKWTDRLGDLDRRID